MGMVAAERVFKVVDNAESIADTGNVELNNCKGEIEFKNVWFAYNDEDWVLKGVSFKVKSGDTLAIIGATGSGKSTIINLLTRNYEINKGDIYIDGRNYLEYSLDSLRDNIAVVLQDVFLFSNSVLHNITLGREISFEEVQKYARDIEIEDFIQSLPNGYNYDVRERGNMLSLGQRQLISFLRAYVTQPKILVLDEATSSIDSESESLIQRSTEKLTKGRTSIVIAHRLATIQNATKILLLDDGKVIEEGTHSELISLNNKYKLLFDLQFKK
ncbi:ATP-binding cassette domain-containing protein [Flavobacteriales bacterium]|nr:ATP-binding cassette domain-containing protein [Flavobacteriales bacterium]